MEEINNLGDPRDYWEREIIAIARRELENSKRWQSEGSAASTAALSHSSMVQAENCKSYADGILYAVRRRREMMEDNLV